MKAALIAPIAISAAVLAVSCGDNSDDSRPAASATINATSAAPNPGTAQIDLAKHSFPVSADDAMAAAKKKFDGTLTKLELEPEVVNGARAYVYKVELVSDTQKFTMQHAAESAAVIGERTEALDADEVRTERGTDAVDLARAVPVNTAMGTAVQAHPGRVEKWKIEGKNNTARYEFDIETQSGIDDDYEAQVDAYSGQLISAG